jgi:hypothetical protein
MLYKTKIINEKTVYLGLYKNHYVYIKNLSGFLKGKTTNHSNKEHQCPNCPYKTRKEDNLKKHLIKCTKKGLCKMPEEDKDKYISFNNYKNKLKQPFVVYSDFECIIDKNKKHLPCGYCLYLVSPYFKYDPIIYRGINEDDTMEHFYKDLFDIHNKVKFILKTTNKEMNLTEEQQKEFFNTKVGDICHICEQKFKKGDKKVRDHDHLNGKYRGAAHDKCNIPFNFKKVI